MKAMSSIRVLWLLNHSTLRKFEILQLNNIGIKEIFMPKSIPLDDNNLYTSIDYSQDEFLTIPREQLKVLNEQNWYENPSKEAWKIVNQYFDIAVIGFFPKQIESVSTYFQRSIILRAFGLPQGHSYTQALYDTLGVHGVEKIKQLKKRFWFGIGYPHLHQLEDEFFKRQTCYLPVGLSNTLSKDQWRGDIQSILFICPRINTSSYFNQMYRNFIDVFSEFDYVIGGVQPIAVNDKNVIGFVSDREHIENMNSFRVMFYPSEEPNQIHYHPLEAIRLGMPVVFMAGGLLDTLSGLNQPGRCISIKDAKKKIKRILNNDWDLIHHIKKSQATVLETLNHQYCQPYYEQAFKNIVQSYPLKAPPPATIKIALFIPIAYSGGSLRGAIELANTLVNGAQHSKQNLELIFAHLNHPELYSNETFAALDSSIKRRTYSWTELDNGAAKRAMSYAGHHEWVPQYREYCVPEDNINQFLDCNLWIIISDRLPKPLLPIKPHVCMVYDYLSRYFDFLTDEQEQVYFSLAQSAKKVLVTTEFTAKDAVQYAGISSARISIMPMLAPIFNASNTTSQLNPTSLYFMWTTNTAKHKNHTNAMMALKKYYEELDGSLHCYITGVNSEKLFNQDCMTHLQHAKKLYDSSEKLQDRLRLLGELPNTSYISHLKNSAFLWHPTVVDNGTFSVIEAAQLGVPSLSSDYPAMREISDQFNLCLNWMDSQDPNNMAQQLKFMENNYLAMKQKLMPKNHLITKRSDTIEIQYWEEIRECL